MLAEFLVVVAGVLVALVPKIRNLETVIRLLKPPDAEVQDPAALLHAFARSTAASRPWLIGPQFRALQNSGHLRLRRNPALARDLAGVYEGPDVPLSQIARSQGSYAVALAELVPAHLQAELSRLSGYFPSG